jgi:hypothetical protein
MADYVLELNEPWTFLNARGNPVEGRRMTFRYVDDTIFVVDVSKADALKLDVITAKLRDQIDAHEALKAL